MKKQIFSGVTALILGANTMFAGLPVVDGANLSQNMIQHIKQALEWAKEASRWTKTVTQYQKVLQAYKDQLNTTSGLKDVVQTINDGKAIYGDIKEIQGNITGLAEILKDPMGFANETFKNTYQQYLAYEKCDSSGDKEVFAMCIADYVVGVAEESTRNELAKDYTESLGRVNDLGQKAKSAKDLKEAQDIANQIAIEQTRLQIIKDAQENFIKTTEAVAKNKNRQKSYLMTKAQSDVKNAPTTKSKENVENILKQWEQDPYLTNLGKN